MPQFFSLYLPPPQAFLGDNERGRIGEHGNELETQTGADGKEKIRERGVMDRARPLVVVILNFSSALISERLRTRQSVTN